MNNNREMYIKIKRVTVNIYIYISKIASCLKKKKKT